MEQLISNINYWMQAVSEDGLIADIGDALGEFKESIREAGFTEQEVAAAFANQYNKDFE